MPAKVTERATEFEEIDRFPGGVGWLAHPEETMQRAGHALATDAGVWVVDPVDADGLDDLLAEFGEVAGVVLLSNYHTRDAGAVAARHGVPVSLPPELEPSDELSTTVERVEGRLPGTDYELLPVAVTGAWQEYALWDGATLVVSESLGTADYICVGDERLGVMTLVRPWPPREALGDLDPERVLTGHGAGVHADATAALEEALTYSRRRLPRALYENGLKQLSTVVAAIRT